MGRSCRTSGSRPRAGGSETSAPTGGWSGRSETRTVERHPRVDALDEYPLVPFLIVDDRRVLYDTSALAQWIDDCHPAPAGRLIPTDPAVAFVARLIEEAFDELGLYMVHHNRWVMSAATNDAGARLAREFRRVLPRHGVDHGAALLRAAGPDDCRISSASHHQASRSGGGPRSRRRRPRVPADPRHPRGGVGGFLAAIEVVLTNRPSLLGTGFTLADAGVYGQLAMNLADPSAADDIRRRAPATFAWLQSIRARRHVGTSGTPRLEADLAGLVAVIARTFVPLMQQNERAYEEARARGETLFNERAFDRGRALYDGTLLGKPFRSVVKTFQVRVWRDLRGGLGSARGGGAGAECGRS